MKKNVKERMKSIKYMQNNQKGITLVALVVTIIVLLILAGITITLLLGDNGIITKAQNAKNKYEMAQEEEQTAIEKLTEEMENIGTKGTVISISNKNCYFILKNSNGEHIFAKEIELYSDNGNEGQGITKWTNDSPCLGYLCTKEGYRLCGWGINQETGDIIKDIAQPLALTNDERIGLRISKEGYICTDMMSSWEILAQISVAYFADDTNLNLNNEGYYTNTESFDGMGQDVRDSGSYILCDGTMSLLADTDTKTEGTTISLNGDAYFILNSDIGTLFTKEVELYVKEEQTDPVLIPKPIRWSSGTQCSGILCTKEGYELLGWLYAESTGGIHKDSVMPINMSTFKDPVTDSAPVITINEQALCVRNIW